MTPKSQQIAIAEVALIGLEWEGNSPDEQKDPKRAAWFWKGSGNVGCCLPDYHSDLNDMHFAEKACWDKLRILGYALAIYNVVNKGKDGHYVHDCLRATASQRAEAFLRTLNLWKEQP